MYKTNTIHSYKYQPLVYFNPPVDTLFTTEKDLFDKTYNLNFTRELPSKSQLMLSRK